MESKGKNLVGENQIQLTIFGPGYGESILIYFGSNYWVIVDSCLNDEEKPAALTYLKNIGVDVRNDVKLIVATHWHDDHVRGLNDTLIECRSAEFALPVIFSEKEFLAYMIAQENQSRTSVSLGAKELLSCMRTIRSRNIAPKFVIQERNILEEGGMSFLHKNDVRLLALSPSDGQYEDFLSQFVNFADFNEEQFDIYRLSKPRLNGFNNNKNELSIGILVSVGEFSILLGSDVIATSKSDRGWKKIIDLRKDKSPRSQIYKVAHHGSEREELRQVYEEIWEFLLTNDPISIVTPWTLCGKTIPNEKDISKLRARSGTAYITSKQLLESAKVFKNDTERRVVSNMIFNCGVVSLTIDIAKNEISNVVLENGAEKL